MCYNLNHPKHNNTEFDHNQASKATITAALSFVPSEPTALFEPGDTHKRISFVPIRYKAAAWPSDWFPSKNSEN